MVTVNRHVESKLTSHTLNLPSQHPRSQRRHTPMPIESAQSPAALPASPAPRVHLASTSQRRRELLTRAGIPHDVGHPGIDDGQLRTPSSSVTVEQWVTALAYLKAASSLRHPGEIRAKIVLGADTVGVHNGRIIGQPKDADDARRIISVLRNAEHQVVTGVALLDPSSDRRELFADRACVRIGDLSDRQVEEYVQTGAWQGKAGGYNLAERLDAGWPITFSGDPATIMGLPIRALVPRLHSFASA